MEILNTWWFEGDDVEQEDVSGDAPSISLIAASASFLISSKKEGLDEGEDDVNGGTFLKYVTIRLLNIKSTTWILNAYLKKNMTAKHAYNIQILCSTKWTNTGFTSGAIGTRKI